MTKFWGRFREKKKRATEGKKKENWRVMGAKVQNIHLPSTFWSYLKGMTLMKGTKGVDLKWLFGTDFFSSSSCMRYTESFWQKTKATSFSIWPCFYVVIM